MVQYLYKGCSRNWCGAVFVQRLLAPLEWCSICTKAARATGVVQYLYKGCSHNYCSGAFSYTKAAAAMMQVYARRRCCGDDASLLWTTLLRR
jgi:hypothetical protein